jgi:SAM-dependent methyltransferase
MKRKKALALAAAGGAAAAVALWWASDKAPYPYAQRRVLDLPLPFLGNADLDRVLLPAAGERMLEIGPGTGLQSLHVAPQLGPDGRLDIVDIQPEMLDHVARRADDAGIRTIVPTLADATQLPFDNHTFDAIYLVTALGEIGRPEQTLAELRRVLRPDGRLVVGEFFDRHWISFGRLHRYADFCGLHLQDRRGPTVAYLASFTPCAGREAEAAAAPAPVRPIRRNTRESEQYGGRSRAGRPSS